MVEPRLADDTAGLSSGRLEGVSLPDLIWMLRGQRKTGVLSLRRHGVEKSIYFDRGRIVFAASSDPDDRLGEMLLRQGVIGLDQLNAALASLHLGKRLGTLLVEAGSMGADKLVSGVLAQVQSIVLDLFTWEEGQYRFEEGTLPTDEVITLDMKTNELLRSGIRRIRSFARTRRSVGPPRTVYGLVEDWRDELEGQSLSEAEKLLIEGLEQGERSVEQLCREVLLSNFEIYETLWVLKVQGVVRERDQVVAAAGVASHQGSLDNEGLAEIMVRLSREEETGVLYVRRRSEERSFHFKQGRCLFATSSNPDNGLVAFLLMRGVISLRDRQETDKRLLSNKRVGTILRELGVIDDKDLRVMVRQQLSEIVYDAFRFEKGDFSFVPGDLPSIEEITLESPVESLVLEGLRRVTSWSRVKRGCGGMDRPLELAPSYMDVLDSMSAGSEEWQVITTLKSSRTPEEICRITKLDDFRACQILWAFKVLGAVRSAAVEQAGEAPARAVEPSREAEESTAAPPPQRPGLTDPAPLPAGGEPDGEAGGGLRRIEVEELDRSEPGVGTRAAATVEPDGVDVPEVEIPIDPSQQTQVISREAVEAALRGERAPTPAAPTPATSPPTAPPVFSPSLDATQAIPREAIEAALDRDADDPERCAETAPGRAADEIGETVETEPEDSDSSIWDLEKSTRTMRLPRDAVDAALISRQEQDPTGPLDVEPGQAPESADEAWEMPGDLESIIAQFNAMQRVVYRTIRAEVGAGAANFIRSCCDTTANAANPLQGAELQADGSWDTEGLRRAIREHRIDDPRLVYQQLIDREIDLLRIHIGDAKVVELERQIEKVEEAAANDR